MTTRGPATAIAAFVLTVGVAALAGCQGDVIVDVRVPVLSEEAQAGQRTFAAHCAACHGERAQGTPQGPPLVHRTYHPNHHGDVAFALAIQRGVRAHHWTFGDMPPQPHVTADEAARITRFVRELQKANGI